MKESDSEIPRGDITVPRTSPDDIGIQYTMTSTSIPATHGRTDPRNKSGKSSFRPEWIYTPRDPAMYKQSFFEAYEQKEKIYEEKGCVHHFQIAGDRESFVPRQYPMPGEPNEDEDQPVLIVQRASDATTLPDEIKSSRMLGDGQIQGIEMSLASLDTAKSADMMNQG